MTNLNKCSLLETLLSRGDQIEFIKGQLVITPASKQPVPKKWLSENSAYLLIEIAALFDINVYVFDSYSTGNYGKHKSPGVTLQLINLTTGEDCYVTFNVELKRSRTSKSGIKGCCLPKGQFRIGKKYKFYKFWLSTGLRLPPRLSSFHDYMGNLKQLYFVPNVDDNNKVIDKIIPLLNIEHSEIVKRLTNNQAYINQTSNIQQPYKNHTNTPYSDVAQPYEYKDLSGDVTTCSNNYELSKQGSAVTSNSLLDINHNKRPEEQTTDEWLDNWEQA
jgi:PBP1b-binding outer membrane lipoprotein LpoB